MKISARRCFGLREAARSALPFVSHFWPFFIHASRIRSSPVLLLLLAYSHGFSCANFTHIASEPPVLLLPPA